MTPKILRNSKILLLVVGLGFTCGCSHKKINPEEESYSPTSSNDDRGTVKEDTGSSDTGNAYGLQTVHFGYDSNALDTQAKVLLRANADALKKNPGIRIQVEGHCDSRGGIQYNIALGDKRAIEVKKYLETLGVSAERIATISYGKERPLDPAETESAYARNRRANFVVTKGLM